jgi:hypothetical protein
VAKGGSSQHSIVDGIVSVRIEDRRYKVARKDAEIVVARAREFVFLIFLT